MLKLYRTYWWSFLIRGILATLFGFAAFFLPGLTLRALAILLAAFLIMDGVFSLLISIRGRSLDSRWWLLLLEGLAGIVIGIVTVIWPGLTILAIMYILGAWALITGILEIMAAIRLRDEIEGEWLLGLSGVLSILFSLILFFAPGVGAIALIWLIGAYAVFFGVSMIFLGFKLRGHNLYLNKIEV
jgi:uncharacterized membrane protein HdeD (DUF308 family)